MRVAVFLALLLAGCSGGGERQSQPVGPPDLENAAIARGVIRDPDDTEISGLYARDTDRVCVVPDDGGYRIGAFVDYGDAITCSGSGTLTRAGERLSVDFGEDCTFDARFDGDRIVFPGNMPEGCARLCRRHASFAALSVSRLSGSVSEGLALNDPKGRLLCASGSLG